MVYVLMFTVIPVLVNYISWIEDCVHNSGCLQSVPFIIFVYLFTHLAAQQRYTFYILNEKQWTSGYTLSFLYLHCFGTLFFSLCVFCATFLPINIVIVPGASSAMFKSSIWWFSSMDIMNSCNNNSIWKHSSLQRSLLGWVKSRNGMAESWQRSVNGFFDDIGGEGLVAADAERVSGENALLFLMAAWQD